jgi:hypothetical protein
LFFNKRSILPSKVDLLKRAITFWVITLGVGSE